MRINNMSVARIDDYESQMANVNCVKIHYLKAGNEQTPLVLLHGFGETSQMWISPFEEFGTGYTIIAPDLRGFGDSARPSPGYDKKTARLIFGNSSRV
jgi:pimeloyl-ACP methyl ester carboxylesterase